uniref:Serpin domain-containing protein n=1 Tax=Romanomermis culicivorax TaxID=13658 RepID=A0A915JS61_ROMCU
MFDGCPPNHMRDKFALRKICQVLSTKANNYRGTCSYDRFKRLLRFGSRYHNYAENNKWEYDKGNNTDQSVQNAVPFGNQKRDGQSGATVGPIRLTNFRLANRLYMAANPRDKNFIVSPYTVQLALYMLYLGAKPTSQTAKQILKHGFDLGTTIRQDAKEKKRGYLKSMIASLTGDSPIIDDYDEDIIESRPAVLKARLYLAINKQFNVESNYKDAIRRLSNHSSSVVVGDFGKDGQKVTEMINGEISNVTNNMIENFLPPGSLNGDTVLSLINVIYLDAEWYKPEIFIQWPFPLPFYLEGGILENLTMFTGTVRALYFENDKLQLIKLPLKGDDHREFGMYIVLPRVDDERTFLGPLETFTKHDEILNITDLQYKNVLVRIPEVSFNYDNDLVEDLESLGIKDIFQPGRGDFSRITNNKTPGLYVKEFRKKVAIVVDTNGVKAAAAVAVMVENRIGGIR